MKMRVARAIEHGRDIKELQLLAADGAVLPDWSAGSHIALDLPLDANLIVVRHYSLLGTSKADGAYRIAVLRELTGRGGSTFIHDRLKTGSTVEVSEPRNEFPLKPSSGHHILLAGGIGITPIMAMAQQLKSIGAAFDLHYLVRTADRAALADELGALAGSQLHLHVGPQPSGFLHRLIGPFMPGKSLYACGPSGLLQAVTVSATALDWPSNALHFESFGSRRAASDQALRVELAQTGTALTVAPGESILDKMISAGAFISVGCGRGECGTCFTHVLQGTPLHRDICLSPKQRELGMCPCVSWAEPATLVLDV